MKFVGKIRGEFEVTQEVVADSKEQAEEILKSNGGQDIEATATGELEILEMTEVAEG